jgi:putative ABC transport system substrate-binding protein
VEGQNIVIERRYSEGRNERLPDLAADLVRLKVDVIVAAGTPPPHAAKRATTTIPIVMTNAGDPVGSGLVASLARPGGNITGFSSLDAPLMGKWLQLLKEIAPRVTRVAVIFNPETSPAALLDMVNRVIEAAAPSVGVTVALAPVHDDAAIEEAIATQARQPGGGLISLPDSFTASHRDMIIAAAIHHRLPLIGASEFFPRAGALMSYWFDVVDLYAQAASYIDRILKGASPADLPVQQPVKFSLVINLKTANALGLTVPLSILQRADEVIE